MSTGFSRPRQAFNLPNPFPHHQLCIRRCRTWIEIGIGIQTYPELERGSTSGQLNRRLQKASGGRGGGSGWCSGELRCLKDPVRGGARHSSALDCRRDWGVPPPEAEVEGLPGPPEPPGIFGYPVGGKGRG